METTFQNNIQAKDNNIEKENLKEPDEQFHNEKYKKKSEFPNFLLKLYQILEKEEYKDIIQWGENGKFFVVKNVHDFTEKILPKYYKHNNYSSFIRQLNMYDFHKKKSSQNEHIFHHQNFIKDQKDLMKSIKRKSKKEKDKDKEIFPFYNNKLINSKHTDLVPFSNVHALKNININKNINIRKSSLSIDDDVNLSNSVHSLFEKNNRPYLPMDISYLNSDTINNNLNSGVNNNFPKKENLDFKNNVNNDINMNGLNMNGGDKKITKKNLESLLNYLNNSIEQNTKMEKDLEIKIERLSKQNEEFIIQNQKMLNEIITKNDYNKKLEAVICFILEMIMTKPKIKNSPEIKNILLSNDQQPNNKIKLENNNLDNLSLVNFTSPKNDINGIFSKNDFSQGGGVLEPFQNFLNKYLEKSKNTGLFTGKENTNYNFNTQQISNDNNNIIYNINNNPNKMNILKRNLICSGNEDNNTINNTQLICKKRKRSNSISSILSDLSNNKNKVCSYNNNNIEDINISPDENMEKIEEKKLDENINNNNDIINNEELNENSNNDSFSSWNKSKNLFDIDLNQEENKSDLSDWNNDLLLNNSQTSLNDL